ncbi:hypothetical protein [Bradyrhizobium sp. NP1]|nr:hypothetical protein [Bradyrhizobium sp. NP1]WJR75500.1 hypothetical protein QOU61_22155 [Bradyrhizobium sp. NP1]
MPKTYDATKIAEAGLVRTCVSQALVGLSALTSTAVLLVQVLPPLLKSFP